MIIKVYKKGRLEKEIDLTPIDDFFKKVDHSLKRESVSDRRIAQLGVDVFSFYEELNCNQKKYFVSRLFFYMQKYADLWQYALDNPGQLLENKEFYDLIKKEVIE